MKDGFGIEPVPELMFAIDGEEPSARLHLLFSLRADPCPCFDIICIFIFVLYVDSNNRLDREPHFWWAFSSKGGGAEKQNAKHVSRCALRIRR